MRDMSCRIGHMGFILAFLIIGVIPVTLFGADDSTSSFYPRILPLIMAAIIWIISKKKKRATNSVDIQKIKKPETTIDSILPRQTHGKIERQYKPIEPK